MVVISSEILILIEASITKLNSFLLKTGLHCQSFCDHYRNFALVSSKV